MDKAKELPSQELLLRRLSYNGDTGELTWKPRTPEEFKVGRYSQERACKIWNTRYAGKSALNTENGHGYKVGAIDGEMYMAHRIIWKMVYGTEPECIDHENGNRSDNSHSNLRSVGYLENNRNQALKTTNKSGCAGVHYDKRQKRWVARIRKPGKRMNLGAFERIEDAIAARKEAEKRIGFHPNHGRAA